MSIFFEFFFWSRSFQFGATRSDRGRATALLCIKELGKSRILDTGTRREPWETRIGPKK